MRPLAAVEQLPPADAFVALAAHAGRPEVLTAWLEPSDRRPNWCYLGEPVRANYGVFGIGTQSTLRTWLSMWSLRISQCTAAPHLRRIAVPALVVHASADACGYASDARSIYHELAAGDKRLEFIKADHYLTEPARARAQAADLIASWVAAHGG